MTDETPATPPKKKFRAKLQPYAASHLKDPASTISTFRKRQQVGPFVIWGMVVLLLVVGIIFLVVWLSSGNAPKLALFVTKTPTVTITSTATSTVTPLPTETSTLTPTETTTPTPSEPFDYTIQENDTLYGIADKFSLGDYGILKIFALNPEIDPITGSVSIGQKIKIPDPNYKLPTSTPIPMNLPFGTKVQYTIQPLDTISNIAAMFNSTFDDIVKVNKITDPNTIYSGQVITVRVNIIAIKQPTITPGFSPTPPSPFTPTPPGGRAPSVTATPTK